MRKSESTVHSEDQGLAETGGRPVFCFLHCPKRALVYRIRRLAGALLGSARCGSLRPWRLLTEQLRKSLQMGAWETGNIKYFRGLRRFPCLAEEVNCERSWGQFSGIALWPRAPRE